VKRRAARLAPLVLVAAVLLPAETAAQPSTSDGAGNVPVPPNEAPIDRFGPLSRRQVQITGGTEDGAASIALELRRWQLAPQSVDGRRALRRPTGTLNLIVSTPLNGADEAQPATLDGLANGTRATLRFGQWVSYTATETRPEAQEIAERAVARCRAEETDRYPRIRQALGATPSAEAVQAVVKAHEDALKECDDPAAGPQVQIDRYLTDRDVQRYTHFIRPRGIRQYGFELSVGRNNFEFVDPATLAEDSERHIQWSGRGFYTWYPGGSKTAISLSAGYERAYEAADEETFCPANPNNIVIRCISARGAPPELNESLLLSLGVRHQVTHGGRLRNVAIAPLVTYDVLDDVWGVDVPVYFIPDGDNGLTGGIRFGYRSDRDSKFSVGIFVGAAFNFLQ